ncbi:hypothetical protein EVAR_40348_1 [Eumeta japonica]|uniref:Uncharacterized protein n=1 Tax=Eumeta variegata TaxID=151549 RepID=A0A4C1XK04_EUMVA|nr:hypothetical protein EVAR_40348_1 [Eumeta japonica]
MAGRGIAQTYETPNAVPVINHPTAWSYESLNSGDLQINRHRINTEDFGTIEQCRANCLLTANVVRHRKKKNRPVATSRRVTEVPFGKTSPDGAAP